MGSKKELQKKLSEIVVYNRPLKEVFVRGSDVFDRVEVALNGERFVTTIDWFTEIAPNFEFLRILFIDPDTVRRVVLTVSPDKLKMERVAGIGEEEKVEEFFSTPICQTPEAQFELHWSIHELEAIPERTLVGILNQLDPRVVLKNEKGEIKLTLKPAIEVAELIGQNLGALPQE